MNSVERVKSICKERKIPISKLEKDLGYSNGYIGQLRKGVFPSDRLSEIAKYLSVSETYIINGEEKDAQKTVEIKVSAESALLSSLIDIISKLNDSGLQEMLDYAEYLYDKKPNCRKVLVQEKAI